MIPRCTADAPLVSFLTREKSRALARPALFYWIENEIIYMMSGLQQRGRARTFFSSFFRCALPEDKSVSAHKQGEK